MLRRPGCAHPHLAAPPRSPCPACLQDDIQEAPLELYHRLKLYDDTGAANPKKPVRDSMWLNVQYSVYGSVAAD